MAGTVLPKFSFYFTFPTGKRLENLLVALDVTAEQLLGRELNQSTSERELLDACHKKGDFLAGYEQQYEHQEEDSLSRFMLHHLSTFNASELYQAILSIYDGKITTAQNHLAEDIADSMLHTTTGLNIDFVLKQEGDEE